MLCAVLQYSGSKRGTESLPGKKKAEFYRSIVCKLKTKDIVEEPEIFGSRHPVTILLSAKDCSPDLVTNFSEHGCFV